MLSEDLLSMIACPIGKARLRQEGETLVCTRCGPRFAIKDEIADLLPDHAELPEGCRALADLECVRCGEARVD